MGRIFNIVDRAFRVKAPHRNFLKRTLPENLNFFYCFGGMAFLFYLISLVTGLMLSLYYVPSETEAYNSIVRITREIKLGWFIRSVHKWTAHLLIIFIMLHTLRVFIYKAYRKPRELNWVAGTLTLVASFASGFTGYLLPWDQRAYWATEVGTSMAGTVPFIGNLLVAWIRGGIDVDGTTLVRFYSIHILWLPLFMLLLLWAHFHMIKRQGVGRGY